ncbi:DinB family protein [Halobacillus hunanensis]|uniref:DinB family protein n=1 Tax=Halobacillus hunanensis TaxID=578214 RepID=UPI0009A72FC4|nr:DinB family protein [Halobacillus hunanensis]
MNPLLSKQYEFHIWAYEKTFRHIKGLPEHIFDKEIENGFPSLSQVFAHVYLVDNIWLGTITEKSFDEIRSSIGQWTEEAQVNSIVEMEKWFGHLAQQYRNFLHDKQGDRVIRVDHPEFGSLTATYSDLLQHVVNHGTYHRGNITSMLRQIGYEGVSTDYLFYLYEIE